MVDSIPSRASCGRAALDRVSRRARARLLGGAALCLVSLPSAATPGEQNTANGVAPVRPGTAAPAEKAAAIDKAAPTAPAPAAPAPVAPAPVQPVQVGQPAPVAEPSRSSEVQRYCQNVAAAAAEARNAWQVKKLVDLQGQVAKTIGDLEAREADLKALIAKREDALKRADETLVGIFSKMKPDAAAAQLSALDDDTAAAVLQQLAPRAAGAILSEIAPDRAVKLVNTIAGTPPADGKKS